MLLLLCCSPIQTNAPHHNTPVPFHPHPPAGIYKPGGSGPTSPATPTPPTTPPKPDAGTATPPKPETPAPEKFPTKGPLAAVPGESTFDGCSPGCTLCLTSSKTTCLACSDVRAYSNINGTCVCGLGRGGPECSPCEVGSYSTGGTLAEGTAACKKCRPGFSTRSTGATDISECNGESNVGCR